MPWFAAELFAALTVGLSFSNVGACIVLAAGCTAEHRDSGKYFIAGRAVGLFAIGIVFVLIGSLFTPEVTTVLLLAFLGLSIILGALMIYEALTGKDVSILERIGLGGRNCAKRSLDNHSCDGHHGMNKGRGSFRRKRFFALGLVRGATPCLKLIVIAPLLIAVAGAGQYLLVFLMLLVFIGASSVYPLIGFIGFSIFGGSEKQAKTLKLVGAVLIIAIGAYMVANHILSGGGASY